MKLAASHRTTIREMSSRNSATSDFLYLNLCKMIDKNPFFYVFLNVEKHGYQIVRATIVHTFQLHGKYTKLRLFFFSFLNVSHNS